MSKKSGFACGETGIRLTNMTPEPDLFSSENDEQTTILFVDTETTGIDPESVEICEIAMILTRYSGFTRAGEESTHFSSLVKPSSSVPPEASAVHHITNGMLVDSPPFSDLEESISPLACQADYISAHNLPYDLTILKRMMPDVFNRFTTEMEIDTLRLSRHVWHEIPSHALQVLRYRFELDSGTGGDAHRALFDTGLVRALLESVLSRGLQGNTNWFELASFVRSPIDVSTFSFGKYRGSLVEDVVAQDGDYVKWLLRQSWIPEEHPDLYHTLLKKSGKRRQ